MRVQGTLWRLCLLSGAVVGWHLPGRDVIDLAIRGNTGSASTSVTSTAVQRMCELGGSTKKIAIPTEAPGTSICSDCVTRSGTVTGTAAPTTLINSKKPAQSSPSSNSKRALLPHLPRATVLPRAPGVFPLLDPARYTTQKRFMETLTHEPQHKIKIRPEDGQIAGWHIALTIDNARVNTPVGITGEWHKWGDTPQNYAMNELSGCTGVFIVGNMGFWAGHFWESVGPDKINGGSSHNYRFGKDDNKEVVVRPVADFKKIAVDPLGQPAPKAAENSFISLHDLKTGKGDPFSETNGGADIYIIASDKRQTLEEEEGIRYADHITALREGLEKLVHATSVDIRTYITEFKGGKNAAGVPFKFGGVSVLQYSPNVGTDSNGCAQAQARIFEEINPTPPVNRKWPVMGASNKRDGAACDRPSTSQTVSHTPSATKTTTTARVSSRTSSALDTEPPCLPFSDPDNGVEGLCQCSNGAKIAPVTSFSTNSATVYTERLCPWTTIPPQALTTAKPTTNNAQYQYTYTDTSNRVIACQTFTNIHVIAGSTYVKQCAGSTALLYQPPLATMEMGSSKVNVGTTMTGEALFTSVSNALTSLCPTPTSSGAWTSCATGKVTVGDAAYLDHGKPQNGDLTIEVTDAQYNSSDYLNLFINMIAGTANATATGSNCKPLDWKWVSELKKRDLKGRVLEPDPPMTHMGTDTFCNINSFLDTQWYDGAQEAAKMWFETEFGFELGELGDFDCASTVGLVGEVLGAIFDAIFPEFAWLITTGVELGELACEAAENFNPTKSRREIEMDKADAKLAKAWAKEHKKDRKLPMPERKKRELGLIH